MAGLDDRLPAACSRSSAIAQPLEHIDFFARAAAIAW